MKRLFTIGHSSYDFTYLVERLQRYNIDWVFDVRSVPFSAYAPQYNSSNLKEKLPKYGISYYEMGEYFGARQLGEQYRYCYPNGYLDFELWCKTVPFLKAKKGLISRGITEHNVALMCTEKDPIDCHRTIMVARDLELDGIETYHILADGSLKTQSQMSKDILNSYIIKINKQKPREDFVKGQGTLDLFGKGDCEVCFDDVADSNESLEIIEKNDSEYLKDAYHELNEKIGYRIF